MSPNEEDSDTDFSISISQNDETVNDLPLEKDPRVSRNFKHDLFGVIPVNVSPLHDNIEEIKNIHDDLVDSIKKDNSSKSGIMFGFDENVEEILDRIDQLNPEDINTISDIPKDLHETAIIGAINDEYPNYLRRGIEKVQDYIVRDETIFTSETPISRKKSGDILKYFSIVSAVIEHRSTMLLMEKLIAEPFREDTEIKKFVAEFLSQHKKEDLLYNCDVIDGDLKRDLIDIRTKRNNFVHNPHERHFVVPNECIEIIDTAYDSAKTLDNILIDLLEERYSEPEN